MKKINSIFKKNFNSTFNKFKDFTMVSHDCYNDNLLIAGQVLNIEGDIVECGVWRGGMIAGIADILGNNRHYHLFDSFEGLPEPQEIDGKSAIEWKNNVNGEFYYDNCKAEIEYANKAMGLANVNFTCIKGWFNETIPANQEIKKIALLRLDSDWYESTYICLEYLFDKVVIGGIIIIDDYLTWDGCSKAVHDFLSKTKSSCKIRQSSNNVIYIIKQD